MVVLSALDSPLLNGIVGPVLTLVVLGLLRYVYKEITGAIYGMKADVLKRVDNVDSKVEGVISEQKAIRGELKSLADGHQSLRERTARLEGKEEARAELAHAAQATVKAVESITHQEAPRHD
jgi:hypothetical protein